MSRYFRFECRTSGVPKKGKSMTLTQPPRNLAEMLVMIRAMGFKPEDIVICDTEYVSEYGSVHI